MAYPIHEGVDEVEVQYVAAVTVHRNLPPDSLLRPTGLEATLEMGIFVPEGYDFSPPELVGVSLLPNWMFYLNAASAKHKGISSIVVWSASGIVNCIKTYGFIGPKFGLVLPDNLKLITVPRGRPRSHNSCNLGSKLAHQRLVHELLSWVLAK